MKAGSVLRHPAFGGLYPGDLRPQVKDQHLIILFILSGGSEVTCTWDIIACICRGGEEGGGEEGVGFSYVLLCLTVLFFPTLSPFFLTSSPLLPHLFPSPSLLLSFLTSSPLLPHLFPSPSSPLPLSFLTSSPLLPHLFPSPSSPLPLSFLTSSPLLPHLSPLLPHLFPFPSSRHHSAP